LEKPKKFNGKVSSSQTQPYRGAGSFVCIELFKFEMPLQFNLKWRAFTKTEMSTPEFVTVTFCKPFIAGSVFDGG
jgi:hypothetical protein